MNIPTNARVNALGGVNVSLQGNDINLITSNPALLDSSLRGQLGVNYSPYLASSKYVSVNYFPKFKKILPGNWAISLQNLNYGTFVGTDALGNLTNDFSANDFSLGITHARKINNISFGITGKLVGSVLESYSSVAFLTDFGGTFKHPKHDLSFGMVAKNIGFVIKNHGNIRPDLPSGGVPFDLQVGATFKPKFMPIRFSLTAHHLYVFDLSENTQNKNFTFDNQGNKVAKNISIADKIARHFVFGGEILIHKNLNIQLGYNFLRRKEFQNKLTTGLAGFCFGGYITQKRVQLSFSHARLIQSGATCFTFLYSFK